MPIGTEENGQAANAFSAASQTLSVLSHIVGHTRGTCITHFVQNKGDAIFDPLEVNTSVSVQVLQHPVKPSTVPAFIVIGIGATCVCSDSEIC